MIVPPDTPLISLAVPGGAVAQIMVVHERSKAGKIKRSTGMMRISESDLRTMAVWKVPGTPTYWCVCEAGGVGLFPRTDREYDVELMGRDGRPIGGNRKPVMLAPIDAYIAGTRAAQIEQAKREMAPPRVERFAPLIGDDNE